MEHLWGIDLGGTKIEGVILNPVALDRPICRLRVGTEPEKGYAHILGQIATLVKMLARGERVAHCRRANRDGDSGHHQSEVRENAGFQRASA